MFQRPSVPVRRKIMHSLVILLTEVGKKIVAVPLFGRGTVCIPCLATFLEVALIIILGHHDLIIAITETMVVVVGALMSMSIEIET